MIELDFDRNLRLIRSNSKSDQNLTGAVDTKLTGMSTTVYTHKVYKN